MNTIRSVGYGWLVLIAAGGGAYYFAKQHVNADREEKYRQMQERRAMNARYAELERSQHASALNGSDHASHPAMEASADPAPTRHAPTTQGQQVEEKSKYEASEVWRSKKGDRLR
ncbi:uncharacterized protein PV09_02167 [Verruconis gallopava]|uniref:Uncharacterized protein n=1 Tax=Verruconis gallopava TaxID=253628 RepID=A0A0D1Z2Z1_9PEZI|nr:uncharacterized protein PV09_02167 [Verruconis gallopava]KIW07317.1 hypothetical protein PV09_02167 [Verruconis gallopava]